MKHIVINFMKNRIDADSEAELDDFKSQTLAQVSRLEGLQNTNIILNLLDEYPEGDPEKYVPTLFDGSPTCPNLSYLAINEAVNQVAAKFIKD